MMGGAVPSLAERAPRPPICSLNKCLKAKPDGQRAGSSAYAHRHYTTAFTYWHPGNVFRPCSKSLYWDVESTVFLELHLSCPTHWLLPPLVPRPKSVSIRQLCTCKSDTLLGRFPPLLPPKTQRPLETSSWPRIRAVMFHTFQSSAGLRSPGADTDSSGKPSRPAGSRRISTSNACVECRRRKIRCDGTQPCGQCQWYQHPEVSATRLNGLL